MNNKIKTTISITLIAILTIFLTSCPQAILTANLETEVNRSSEKEITEFSFKADDNQALLADVIATIEETEITATVPYGTDVTALIATFTTTGSIVTINTTEQISGVTANDFTNPVSCIVTAADESYTTYSVTVSWGNSSRAAVENQGFAAAVNRGDSAEVFLPDSDASFKMIMANDGSSITFPINHDDSGSHTFDNKYFVGETEVTNEVAAAILQWAYDNNRFSEASSGDHNYLSTATAKYGTKELINLDDATRGVCRISYDGAGTFSVEEGYEDHPMTHISWFGSAKLCNWLTEMRDGTTDNIAYLSVDEDWDEQTTLFNPARTGFRLVTTFEFDFAARYRGNDQTNTVAIVGGVAATAPSFTTGESASGATADYNDTIATTAVAVYEYTSNAWNDEQPVKSLGSASANTLGFYDMTGNIKEWLWGAGYSSNYGQAYSDWDMDNIAMINYVFGGSPNNSDGTHGFRIARTAD